MRLDSEVESEAGELRWGVMLEGDVESDVESDGRVSLSCSDPSCRTSHLHKIWKVSAVLSCVTLKPWSPDARIVYVVQQ